MHRGMLLLLFPFLLLQQIFQQQRLLLKYKKGLLVGSFTYLDVLHQSIVTAKSRRNNESRDHPCPPTETVLRRARAAGPRHEANHPAEVLNHFSALSLSVDFTPKFNIQQGVQIGTVGGVRGRSIEDEEAIGSNKRVCE